MKREISWSVQSQGSAYSTSKITCCFGNECDTQENDATSSYGFDFNKLVLESTSATAASRMDLYAKNKYSCTVSLCNNAGCSASSSPATIRCPSQQFRVPTQLTGDPSSDGWFFIGNSDNLGSYVRNLKQNFDIYVASFTWKSEITTSNFFRFSPEKQFTEGDPVIGIGFVLKSGTLATGDFGFKVDPTGENNYSPSSITTFPGDGVGSFSSNCLAGNFLQNAVNFQYYSQCPTPSQESNTIKFGNYYKKPDDTALEYVFNAASFDTLTNFASFRSGWKVVEFLSKAGISGDGDAIAFGLPYCNGN